ncbi:type II secretion system protein GspG [Candidatus Dependentiae bacterium]|nr:type II secretion system protein GspG [Candidatus Dependentiae bacterium]
MVHITQKSCVNDSRMRRNKPGFSLIEITIVIMIIGVLAAGAFGGLRMLQRVKASTTNSKLAALDSAIEQYNTMVGEYPTELRELSEGPQKPQLRKKWGEPVATEDELKDAWGKEFVYTLGAKGARPPYSLESTGSTGDAHILSPKSQE